MNQHQQIMAEFETQYALLQDVDIVGPKALASRAFDQFVQEQNVELHIQYASMEHLKHMARRFLAKRADPSDDENEVYHEQGELAFSGNLQARYPVPRSSGDEPVYKLRSLLTSEERAWNVQTLRKSAFARQEHADALEAEGQQALAA